MRRALPAAAGLAAAILPVGTALAAPDAAPTKKVTTTTKTYTGPEVEADRWGPLQVTVMVKTTTSTVGKKNSVTRKITKVGAPEYPDHTNRSVYINQTALPMLFQEVLQAQSANVDLISRATDTSDAFVQSLQGALAAAKVGGSSSSSSSSGSSSI